MQAVVIGTSSATSTRKSCFSTLCEFQGRQLIKKTSKLKKLQSQYSRLKEGQVDECLSFSYFASHLSVLKIFFEATGESKETFFSFEAKRLRRNRKDVEFFYTDALQRFNRRARAEVPTVKQPRK